MITFDQQTIILAIVGMTGLFASATVLAYSFKRNRTAKGNWQ